MSESILAVAEKIKARRNVIYGMALYIILFATIFSSTVAVSNTVYPNAAPVWNVLFRIMRYIGYLLIFSVIASDFCLNNIRRIPAVLCMAAAIIAAFMADDMQIIIYIAVVTASANISFKKILRIYMQVLFGTLMFIVLLTASGILKNFIYDFGTRNRYTLGFVWTTIGPMLFLFATSAMLCLQNAKTTVMTICMTGFCALLLFVMTNSRFIFVIQACVILLMLAYKKNKKLGQGLFENKIVCRIAVALPFVLFVLSIIMPLLYSPDNAFWEWINNFLSGRLGLARSAIDTYGFSLFGQRIEWIGHFIGTDVNVPYNFVDSSYVNILLNYGAVIMALVLFAYTKIIINFIKKKEYVMTITVILVLLLSYTEPRLINIMFNPFILAAGELLSKSGLKERVHE